MVVAFATSVCAFAQERIANPFIFEETQTYWYDTFASEWITSAYPGIGDAYTFAVDITPSTALVEYLAEDADETDGTWNVVGIHNWTENSSDVSFALKKIKDNIYGMDVCVGQWINKDGNRFSLKEENPQVYFKLVPAQVNGSVWDYEGTRAVLFENPVKFVKGGSAEMMPAPEQETELYSYARGQQAGLALPGTFVKEVTGIEEVIADSVDSDKAQKVIVDGQVVIVKDGKAYNILGSRIK